MEQIKITLEPRGKFVIELSDGQFVKGWFSVFALNRFCVANGGINYIQLVVKITTGMTLEDYAELLLYAIQDFYRADVKQCIWTKEKVMDEIMEYMPAGSDMFLDLFKHAIGRVVPLDKLEEITDEKKNLPGN